MKENLIVLLQELSYTYNCKAYRNKINKVKFAEHILCQFNEKLKNLNKGNIVGEDYNIYKYTNITVYELIEYAIDNGYIDTAVEDSRYLIMLNKGERFLQNSLNEKCREAC